MKRTIRGNRFRDSFGLGMLDVIPSAGVAFSDEYQIVHDSWINKPSSAVAAAQNIMVEGWVADGEWATRDVIYLFAGHTNDDGESLTNWKSPGTYDATIVLNGGTMNFTAFEGFQSDDGAYLRLHWNPNTNGVNYVQDNAGTSLYCRTNLEEDSVEFGVVGTGDIYMQLWNTSDNTVCRINKDSNVNIGGASDSRGYWCMSRRAFNDIEIYRNGGSIAVSANASTGIESVEMFALGWNNGGIGLNSTRQVSLLMFGGSYTDPQAVSSKNTIETYMDSNGKGVIA